MGLRRWLLILLCVARLPCGPLTPPKCPGQIRLASEAWNDYANADGSGLTPGTCCEKSRPPGQGQDPQRALHPFRSVWPGVAK